MPTCWWPAFGPVPFVERQVQAHLVPLSEPVPPVGVRFHLEAERRVMRQRAPQVAAVMAEEPVDALPVLQPRLPERQQHPVGAPDLQPHMIG